MEFQQEQIKLQQKQSWNRFSPGWKKWDDLVMKFMKPIADIMIEHLEIQDTDMVLDIAAGTGEPGLTIATMITKGSVIGTDLSEEMLSTAGEKAKALGLSNYNTQVADVCELPFSDDTFNKLSSRMGFMFFPDMQLAANEMYRVLTPGGKLAISVWGPPQENLWVGGMMGIINKYIESPPPVPGAPGMFRCAKPGLMAETFSNAGFKNIGEQPIIGKAEYDDADTYWQNMMDCAAPVVALMDKADEITKAAIKNEVYALISAHIADDLVQLDFGANIVYCEK